MLQDVIEIETIDDKRTKERKIRKKRKNTKRIMNGSLVLDRFERHLLFGKIYAQTVEDFTTSNCMYNKDTLKTGTARRLGHFCSLVQF